ncbi:6-bladed beta-propeller [Candidatus Zixiibacteriota bacterium]
MKTRTTRQLSAILTIILLTGCAEQGPGPHRFEKDLEDGAMVVVNHGAPRFEGDLFRFEQRVMLIQDTEVPASLLYPGPTRPWDEKGFLMDEEGSFYVQDRGNDRIAVFDPAGRYERSIGRSGDGPGEFAFPHLTGINDGMLEIYDEALHRIIFYQIDGTFSGSVPSPVGGGGADIPFTSYPSMAFASGRGIYLTTGMDPVLFHHRHDGLLIRKITLDLPVRRVTRSDRLRYMADLEHQIADAEGDDLDLLMAMRETLIFRPAGSHWRAITIDDSGFIWLEVPEWDEALNGEGDGCLFQILSPEGEFLGSTRAPASGRIMNGYLLGVVRDRQTGREDYVAWRLNPRAAGFVYP